MGRLTQPAILPRGQRVDSVDYAKGFCIVFVVMMHSTLGVENAAGREGWLHAVVDFARPFRMPDFFLISGLFLSRVINRDWTTFLDRRVLHFVYFYVLWLIIQFAFKAPGFVAGGGPCSDGAALCCEPHLGAVRNPVVHLDPLPVFAPRHALVPRPACRAGLPRRGSARDRPDRNRLHRRRRVRVPLLSTSSLAMLFAPVAFSLAARTVIRPGIALAGLAVWAVVNGAAISGGLSQAPGVSLVLGFPRRFGGRRRGGAGRRGSRARKGCACARRAEINRRLSRLLPADGGDADPSSCERDNRSRCRNHVAH